LTTNLIFLRRGLPPHGRHFGDSDPGHTLRFVFCYYAPAANIGGALSDAFVWRLSRTSGLA